jgi:hypothetical protein
VADDEADHTRTSSQLKSWSVRRRVVKEEKERHSFFCVVRTTFILDLCTARG